MRSFYKVLDVLRTYLESNEDVNTIMFGAPTEGDLNKKNIYPLVVINPTNSSLDTASVSIFDFSITALDVRDISKNLITDKFLSNDNEIDNLNLTHSILNMLMKQLRNLTNEYGVEVVSASGLAPIIYSNVNILDGWELTIQVQIPNITANPCL